MAMYEAETLTNSTQQFGRHNEDYGTDIRDTESPDPIGGVAPSQTYILWTPQNALQNEAEATGGVS